MKFFAHAMSVALLTASASTAYAEGIEVKGVTLGEPESALERVYPVPGCEDTSPAVNTLGDRYCSYPHSTYAGFMLQLSGTLGVQLSILSGTLILAALLVLSIAYSLWLRGKLRESWEKSVIAAIEAKMEDNEQLGSRSN